MAQHPTAAPISAPSALADAAIPDAPTPQVEFAVNEVQDAPDAQQPAQSGAGQGSSNTSQSRSSGSESKQDLAGEQIKQEEKQRVLGVLPNFNITYLGGNTVSLTAKQKFTLAAHTIVDPVTFITPFFVAGYHEVVDDDNGFPWGVKGLGERAGAAYLDDVTGTLLGDAILPSLLHQDPRYFRMGYGKVSHRLLYAVSTNVRAKHDKTGKWEPNYSNIGGNILSGAISNLYYPDSNSGIGLTITNGLIVTSETALGSIFYEFWPDLSRKVLHKDPTHGLDAQFARERAKQQDSAPPQK